MPGRFPLRRGAQGAPLLQRPLEHSMETAKRIYLLDDDVEICELLQEYLSDNGFQVRTAHNATDFFALWNDSPADLVVLDIMLPGDDGFAVLRRLREALPRADHLPLRAGRQHGPHRRPGAGSGRLPRQALLSRASCWPASVPCCAAAAKASPPHRRAAYCASPPGGLDTTARHLLTADDVIMPLSGAEYRLLTIFLQHPRQVLSRGHPAGTDAGPQRPALRPQHRRAHQPPAQTACRR